MDTRPSEADLARYSGIAPSMIALALSGSPAVSEDLRARVLGAARAHAAGTDRGSRLTPGEAPQTATRPGHAAGTQPAPPLAIGIVVPVLAGPFVEELLHSLQRECEARGTLALATSSFSDPEREAVIMRQLRILDVSGLFVLGSVQPRHDLRRLAERCPLVVSPEVVGGCADTIRLDEDAAADLVLDHLWDRGWRKVVYVAGWASPSARRAALRRAAHDRGVNLTAPSQERGLRAMVERGALEWATSRTAVVCGSGMVAMEVAVILRGLEVAPGADLAVIAYDDAFLAGEAESDLTSVEADMEHFAGAVVGRLLGRIEQPGAAGGVVETRPLLVVRGSS